MAISGGDGGDPVSAPIAGMGVAGGFSLLVLAGVAGCLALGVLKLREWARIVSIGCIALGIVCTILSILRPMRWSYPTGDFVFQDGAEDLQPCLTGQLFHLRLHLGPHLGHRQRHPHQQLSPSHHLELVIGLALFPLVIVSHSALSFKKGFSTRTLTEFGREPLLLVLKFQLNAGHPRL